MPPVTSVLVALGSFRRPRQDYEQSKSSPDEKPDEKRRGTNSQWPARLLGIPASTNHRERKNQEILTALTCFHNSNRLVVEHLKYLSDITRNLLQKSDGSLPVLQQPRPVVEHSRNLSGTTRNLPEFSDGSHLLPQQLRPIVERCRQAWVIRA